MWSLTSGWGRRNVSSIPGRRKPVMALDSQPEPYEPPKIEQREVIEALIGVVAPGSGGIDNN